MAAAHRDSLGLSQQAYAHIRKQALQTDQMVLHILSWYISANFCDHPFLRNCQNLQLKILNVWDVDKDTDPLSAETFYDKMRSAIGLSKQCCFTGLKLMKQLRTRPPRASPCDPVVDGVKHGTLRRNRQRQQQQKQRAEAEASLEHVEVFSADYISLLQCLLLMTSDFKILPEKDLVLDLAYAYVSCNATSPVLGECF